jgi:CheY-like chemotaxis protein
MDPRPARVLVVEDDDEVATVLSLALVDEGYSVRQAGDADVALAIRRVRPLTRVAPPARSDIRRGCRASGRAGV